MLININMANLAGEYSKFEVRAYCPFKMYGHTFAAHRKMDFDPVMETVVPAKYDHVVTEVETGFVVAKGRMRVEALSCAKKRLRSIGKKAFARYIESAGRQITRGGE